jgi:hypothetical protein
MDVECPFCGALHWDAEKTSASRRGHPRFGKCCRDGQVSLPAVKPPPEDLLDLYTSRDGRAVAFRESIRWYNSALAFTSVSYKSDIRTTGGVQSFQIHGQLCHLHGPLESNNNATPRYAQVWFYDQQMATDSRMALANSSRSPVDGRILTMLTEMLRDCNPWIQLYRTAREQLQANEERPTPVDVVLTAELRLIQEVGADRRRENLPTASEIAAVIPDVGPGWEKRTFRDMRLQLRTENPHQLGLRRVDPSHAAYIPLAYVLLFPHGDPGWHWGLRLRNPDSHVPPNPAGAEEAVDETEQNPATPEDEPEDEPYDPEPQYIDEFAPDEDGNGGNRRKPNNDRVTMLNYHAYRLFTRRNEFTVLHRACRLFQQYIVDAFATIDQLRLNWFIHNQQTIRADLYSNADNLALTDGSAADDMGQRVVLPSSYIGGDRFMQTKSQDAMALVGHFGRPTFFITFTANPNWKDIQQELLPGQTALDRPDLVARVFHMKATELLDHVAKRGEKAVLGHAFARVWTIEYQKRGMPHMHLLLWVKERHLYLQPELIDELISAEIPPDDWNNDPELAGIVKQVMIHGPCGEHDPTASCMLKDERTGQIKCQKKFPKPFQSETTIPEDGYPIYRRRENPATAFVKKLKGKDVRIDNRWVVPYSPYLTSLFKAHINVEICTSIMAIKYLFKYIYKGPDRTTAKIDSNDNEVDLYVQCRYIGPTEGCWRLFKFHVHEEWPPVYHLSVHEPDRHPFAFSKTDTPAQIAAKAAAAKSLLMGFFEYNRNLAPDAVCYKYAEMPTHYIWDKPTRRWKRRQRLLGTIGRMFHCGPNRGELFYIRLLLTVKVGPTSFEDLRTVDGELHPTFRAACQAMGLLEDDQEWLRTFEEAAHFRTGTYLRSLFTIALLHGSVTDPPALWAQFKHTICDDLPHRLSRLEDWPDSASQRSTRIDDYGLFLISKILAEANRTLSEFGLPEPETDWQPIFATVDQAAAEETSREEYQETAIKMRQSLNDDQRVAFERIITSLEDPGCDRKNFYIQGPGGTGKTYLYRALYSYFVGSGKTVLCVASSGIAALLLPNGRTAHSQFRIPLDVQEHSVCNIKVQSELAKQLCEADLIVWDEVPMTNRYVFEAVDRTLRDITKKEDSLFGGIPFVLGGDFAQTLPVIVRGSRAAIVSATLQKSHIWENLEVLPLRQNMRLQGVGINASFAQWLGRMSYDPALQGNIELPAMIPQVQNEAELCEHVFPAAQLRDSRSDPDFFASRAILAVRNVDLKELNKELLEMLPGNPHTLYSVDRADITESTGDGREEYSREFLQTIEPNGLPPSILQLKIGAPIMLIRNLRPTEGLCNGTRLVVLGLTKHVIHARILTGDRKGQETLIPRIQLNSLPNEVPFQLTRRQFPVKLCFAITINKSQGQSLQTVGIDLRTSPFSHGQLYVALSRVTDVRKLTVLLPENRKTTHNIVFPEVLKPWQSN